MTSWSYRPTAPPCPRHERLAAARDLAIIAVCAVILAFALLALVGTSREAPQRAAAPAVHVSM